MSTTPVKVAVTGAAGQIGYSLLFRIASGALLGPDTPVELRLLEITPALKALEGVVMELDDCAFPTLAGVQIGDDATQVFDGANLAMLVGAMPRKEGMDRADLLAANGKIFTGQGKALNDAAADDIKVLVTGNPANTNALIAMTNAPDIPNERFNALTRLDHNRAKSASSPQKLGVPVTEISNIDDLGQPRRLACIPTSTTRGRRQDRGRPRRRVLDHRRVHPDRRQARRRHHRRPRPSSAASAANATIDHMRDWVLGTDDWVSMSVPSDGSYGVTEGIVSSFPCTVKDGTYEIVQGIELSDFSKRAHPGLRRPPRGRARRGQGARPHLSSPDRRGAGHRG